MRDSHFCETMKHNCRVFGQCVPLQGESKNYLLSMRKCIALV